MGAGGVMLETIEGVEGQVAVRTILLGEQLFLEAELQDPGYRHGQFGAPPILRIPIEDDSPEKLAAAKAAIPEGVRELFADAG